MSKNHEDERRASDRMTTDFLLNKYVKGRPYLCQASNISPRGLLVQSFCEPVTAEPFVGLQFQLPGFDEVITCTGRVVHRASDSDWSGVLFTSLAWEHRLLIEEYIRGQAQDMGAGSN